MISILIPHYKEGRATAYSVSQFLKYSEGEPIEIVVVDNSYPDESIKYLEPFKDKIKILPYITNKISSHGICLDYAVSKTNSEYVICAESDCFPTGEFMPYYKILIEQGYGIAGSLLKLSGGEYLHGAGALYSRKLWEEAKQFCDNIPYIYIPNFSHKNGFDCHLMIHKSISDEVLNNPSDWVEVAQSYKGLSKEEILKRVYDYSSTTCPFHNGMGGLNEDIRTYGQRGTDNDSPTITLENSRKLIHRIGYEPHQFLYYFAVNKKYKIGLIPTEIKWLPNREGQQQEYTLNEAGIKHIWCGSSYLSMKDTLMHDVYEAKKNQIEQLYNSLPNNQKIN